MALKDINVRAAVAEVEELLEKEKGISASLKAAIKVILVVVKLLSERFKLNSSNSSLPPALDPNRKKQAKNNENGKKPGGQPGHVGTRLKKVKNPDEVKVISVDRKTLPPGKYKESGYESRQVIELKISRHVIEYRAEILIDKAGKRFVAPFPKEVGSDVSYGKSVKAYSVNLSQYQLLPYARIEDHFRNQMKIPLSAGTICNFNREAYKKLKELKFDEIAKANLIASSVLHADETGMEENGKRTWIHTASTSKWSYLAPHDKRGGEAMKEINILPQFKGTLSHDHWKPYYIFDCLHSLCNAHHCRELKWAFEEDNQQWAGELRELLLEMNQATEENGGAVSKEIADLYRKKYREILSRGDTQCPRFIPVHKKRGKAKQSKSRNLLERLRDFEDDTLRFLEDPKVPFTNNQSENDLRMTKVQQKISGCFRSREGAETFCLVRSYLITSRKHAMGASEALTILFEGKLPDFMKLPETSNST